MSIFDSLSIAAEPELTPEEKEAKKRESRLNPETYVAKSAKWEVADPETRSGYATNASEKIRGLYAEDPKSKVVIKVEREGKVVDEEVSLFDDKGQPTPEGNDYFGKIDSYLHSAAVDPNGGVEVDPFTGKKRTVYGLKAIREEPLRKPVQFGDVAGFKDDVKNGFDVGGEKDLTFARYARWRNEKTDRPIDANDLDAQKAFDAQKEFTEFDPSSFGPDEKLRMVGGFPKFNEKFLGDKDGVKAEIVALEGVSVHQKNEFLKEFQIEAYKPVEKRLQLEKDVFDSVTKNSRSYEANKKALGDDKGQSRMGEDAKDNALEILGRIGAMIDIPLGGLKSGYNSVMGNPQEAGPRDLYEGGTFNEALGTGDLIAARDNELKNGGILKGTHVKVMNELIERFKKEGITDGKEMGIIMRDTVKRNVWAAGEEDKIRQLENGELVFDPKSIAARDPKEMHGLIESQNASKEQKIALKRDYDFRRSYFAKAVYDGPLAEENGDFKEWKAENKAKGITDPAKVLYSWKGLKTGFGESYGWLGTTGNAIWDPLAGGGRGIANAGWSGSAMATTALSEGTGAIGLDRVSNWLKSGTVRAMEEVQENQGLTAKDEALAGLRGERGPVRGVWNSTATSGVQMIPMFVGGGVGGMIKGASGTNKGLQALGTSVQNLGVYGYAGVQGAQSIYETALQKGEEKASLEGRKMSDDERYAVIQDNWIPALSNGVQTAMLTKLFAGTGVERMALGRAGAGGGGLTIKEILSQGVNVAQKTSSWKEALRSIKPEIGKVLKTFHADAKGELIEETANQVIEGFIQKASVNPDKTFVEMAGEAVMGGFQGFLLGGAIPAATSAFSFNDKKGHQEAIKYAMVQQYSDKIQADTAAGKPTVEEGSSEEMMKHFEFISEKTKDYNKLREEKNFTGALAINDEIDAATKTVSEKFGLGEMDGKVWDRYNGNKSAPAMAAIFSNPNIEHKDKVELLLQAAKGQLKLHSVNTEAPAEAPVAPSETTPVQAPSAPKEEAKKEVVGDVSWTLKAMGVDPGANRTFKPSEHNPVVNDKGIKVAGGTLHAININGQPGAGAVLRSTDENGDPVEQHLTPEKALALLPNPLLNTNVKADRAAYESAVTNHASNLNEWSQPASPSRDKAAAANAAGTFTPKGVAGTPSGNDAFDKAQPQESILFDEETHTYYEDGQVKPSVTELKGKHPMFSFDEDSVAAAMAHPRSKHQNIREKSIYFKKTAEEIKAMWKANTEIGSKFHAQISAALLNPEAEHEPHIKEVADEIRAKIPEGSVIVSEKMVRVNGAIGTLDLFVEIEMKDGSVEGMLFDFKSMEKNPFKTLEESKDKDFIHPYEAMRKGAWGEGESTAEGHRVQLAAYKAGLEATEIKVTASFVIPIDRATGKAFRNPVNNKFAYPANPTEKTKTYVKEIYGDIKQEKQDRAGAGANPKVAPPGKEGARNTGDPKGGVAGKAPSVSPPLKASSPEPVASPKGVDVVEPQMRYPAPIIGATAEQKAQRDAQVAAHEEWEEKYGATHFPSGRPKVSPAKEAPSATPAVDSGLGSLGGAGKGIGLNFARMMRERVAEGKYPDAAGKSRLGDAFLKRDSEQPFQSDEEALSWLNDNDKAATPAAEPAPVVTDEVNLSTKLTLGTVAKRLETVSSVLATLTGKSVEVVAKRPDSATYEKNLAAYKGDENVWSYDGKVFMSQGFLNGLGGKDKAEAFQMLQDKARAMGLLKETSKPLAPVVEAPSVKVEPPVKESPSTENEIPTTEVEEDVLEVVESSLLPEEQVEAAEILGEKEWNETAKKAFVARLADWLVTGKDASKRLIELFRKVAANSKTFVMAGVVAVSLQTSVAPEAQAISMTMVAIEMQQAKAVQAVEPMLAPVPAVAEVVRPEVKPMTQQDVVKALEPQVTKPAPVQSAPAPKPVPKPVAKASFSSADVSTNIRVMADWVIGNNDNHDAPFAVADKTGGKVWFFDANGNESLSIPALFGRRVGDEVVTDGGVSYLTPAGRFDSEVYESQDYGPTVRFDRVGNSNFLIHRIPSHSVTASPAQRKAALQSSTSEDNRMTSGCINIDKSMVPQVTDHFSNGGVVYVMPETESGKEVFEGFKGLEIPSDSNAVSNESKRKRQKRKRKEITLNATAASKTTDTSKSDLLSNTLTNSDPLAPMMSVDENVLSGEEKPSYLKGAFSKDGETYTYVPDKGTTLPLSVGSLIAIKGSDSVLAFIDVVNGQFVFRRIDFGRVEEMGRNGKRKISNVNSLSRNWNTTRIAAIAPQFLKLLPKISSGELSDADARKLLDSVIKLIAPGRSIESIQEAELSGDQFFQAFSTPVEVTGKDAEGIIAAADKKFYKGVPGIRVDYKKFTAQLATLSQGHKSGDADMDMLVAMDAARQVVSWMGEENIHTLTFGHFTVEEIEKFFADILSDKAHPFHDLLRITAKEQFPDIELSEADDTEGFAYTVASEMMRKLQQIRQTGSTSEVNAAYARRLVEVINNKSLTGKVKATVELVKRFFERMRRILYLRQAMNQITPEQKLLLNRLNQAYLDAGFNEDVDNIKAKQTQEQILLTNAYTESTRLEIDKVAAKNSTPLMRLREVARDVFVNVGINIVHVDPETHDMTLDPAAAEYLKDNHPLFDAKEINKALAELSDTEAFKKSLTQSYFLSEIVKSRLEELDFNPSGVFDFLKGSSDYNVGSVYSEIWSGSRVSGDSKESVAREALEEHIFQLQKAVDSRVGMFKAQLLKWFDAKDISSTKRIINLSKLGSAIGIQVDPSESNDPEMQVGTEKWRRWLQSQVSTKMLSVYDDAIAVIMKNEKFRGQFGETIFERDVSVGQSTVAEALEEIERAKALLAASQQLSEESGDLDKAALRSQAIKLNENASILDSNARAAGRNSSKEATVLRYKASLIAARLATDIPAAQEKQDKFYRYMKALKDYNESVDGVLYRAIGRNNPDKREFGLDFRDTSFNINTIEDKKKGSPGNGSKAQPFGIQMANPPEVTQPSDFAGYNVNTPFNEKGTKLPGYGNPRMSKPTDTPEHRELWDNHYRQVFGNAKYRGRHAINWFMLQDALGNLPMDLGSRDDFMRTAGFNLASTPNNKLEIRLFENHNQAFPGLNLYDQLFTLLDTMKEDGRANASRDFQQVVDIFSQTKAWANKIRSKVEGDGFIGEINGVPTLAGEAKVLLDRKLKEFDEQMKGFESALFGTMDLYFRSKLVDGEVQYLENSEGLIKRDGVSQQGIYSDFNKQISSFNPNGPQALMVQAMSSLNTSVKIVRKSLESFQDKDWQRNQEEEMDRTLNDYAYTPDHSEMLALRDQKLDPSIVRMLSWKMRFHEKGAGYSVGSLHAYELLGERLKGEWSNDGRLLVTKFARAPKPDSLDPEGLGVSSVGGIENSGHMPLAFATGEQGNTRDSTLNEKVGATQSTAAERNARELMTPYQIQRQWLTRSLMFLGYGKGLASEGDANAAKDFAYDVIQQSEGTTRKGLHDLMVRGLAGAFSMVYRNTPAFDNLVEMFVEANPEWHYAFGEDSSVVFDESDRKVLFDPETFAADILMFKAKFETDALEKARINEKASVTEVMENLLAHATVDPTNDNLNLDNSNFNQGQDGRPSLNLPSEINERNATLVRAFKADMNSDRKMGLYDPRVLESRKDLGGLVAPLEDTFMSGGLFVDNPALGVLLQNLTGGKLFVYVPSTEVMKREGITHGVVTISRGDMTLIVTPPGVPSSQEEVKTAMRHALLHHSASSKEAAAAINEMGARVREMFDPVFRTQQLMTGMEAQKQSIIDEAIHHPAYTGSRKQLTNLDATVKAMVAKRIAEHLEKTAGLFETNGLFMGRSHTWNAATGPLMNVPTDAKGRKSKKALQAATRSSGGLVDTIVESNATRSEKLTNLNEHHQNQLEDNVDLVTDILTDPKFKEMFDAAFLGTDEINDNTLSDVHNLQLFGAIHGIRNTLESNEGFPDEKFTDESHTQAWNDEQQEEDERSAEEIENERIDRELSEDENMRHIVAQIADNLGGVMKSDGTLLLPENSSVLPDAAELNHALKNIGALLAADSKKEAKLLKLNGSDHVINPGDAALLNMLARIVVSAKEKTSKINLDNVLVTGETPKRILDGLPTGELGLPIISPINKPTVGDKNNSPSMGSWINATRGASHGRTAQTIAFAFVRQDKMRAGLVAQLSSVQKALDLLAKKRVATDLMDQPNLKEHGTVFADIALDSAFIAEMDEATGGLVSKHIAETEEMISDLRDRYAKQTELLERVKNDIEDRLLPYESSERELFKYVDSDMFVFEDVAQIVFDDLGNKIIEAMNEGLYEGGELRAGKVISNLINKRLSPTGNLLLKAHREKAGRLLNEIQGKLELRKSGFAAGSPKKTNVRDKAIEDLVKDFNATIDTLMKGVNTVVREGFGQVDMASAKVDLPRPRLVWNDGLSDTAISDAIRAMGRIASPKAVAEVVKDVMLSRTTHAAAEKFGRGKGSREFTDQIAAIVKAYDTDGVVGMKKVFTEAMDALANKDFDISRGPGKLPGTVKHSGMMALLKGLILNNDEVVNMLKDGVKLPSDVAALEDVKQLKRRIEESIKEINASLKQIGNTNDSHQLGRYYHDVNAGLEKSDWDPKSTKKRFEIAPTDRQVPVTMNLVPDTHHPDHQVRGSLDQARLNFLQDESERFDFYAKREGVMRALAEFTDGRLEEAYKRVRGGAENFSTFNPFAMIRQSIKLANIEKMIMDEREAGAKTLAEQVAYRGMTVEAIAAITGGDFYTVSEDKPLTNEQERAAYFESPDQPTNRQKRVAFHKSPQGFGERMKLAGHLFDDGKPILLMAQDARTQLMEQFPGVTKHNVDSLLKEQVLNALTVNRALAGKRITDSYMLEFDKGYLKGDFDPTGYRILAGQTKVSRQEAGKVFVASFVQKIQAFVEDRGKNPLAGLKDANGLHVLSDTEKLSMDHDNVKKVIALYSNMIEKIVYAQGHKLLDDEASRKVRNFLLSISEAEFTDMNDPENVLGGFANNDNSMQQFDLMGTFSTVFSAIEGDVILRRLAVGLSSPGLGSFGAGALRLLHGQDSRIRSRFIKDAAAHDTAIHLQAFLEQGFDGQTGREGAEAQSQRVNRKISDSLKTIGNNSLDHAIAKDIATLEGIKHNRGMGVKAALEKFHDDYTKGFKNLLQYDLAQRDAYRRIGSKFFNSKHIQLTDDIPMAKEKDELLTRGLHQIVLNSGGFSGNDSEENNQQAIELIDSMIADLLKGRKKEVQIKAHAELVEREMRSISDAMAISRAVLSHGAELAGAGELTNEWKHDPITAFEQSYSSVPMSFSYAAAPGKETSMTKGQYISDPALLTSLANGSIYGGPGKFAGMMNQGRIIYRPLQVNGITSINSLVEDSIYRMNVAPNYEVLRRLVGRTESPRGIPTATDSKMLNDAFSSGKVSHDVRGEFNHALAAVATELESNLQNDATHGVDSTRFARVMELETARFIWKALGSPWQLVNQSVGPSLAVILKKLITLQGREAMDFTVVLAKILTSASVSLLPDMILSDSRAFKNFNKRISDFNHDVSIYTNKQGMDGIDNTKNVIRNQLSHGSSPLMKYGGYAANKFQSYTESYLDNTIGAAERTVGRAVFAMEMMSELRKAKARGEFAGDVPKNVDELIKLRKQDIPTLAKARARIKVSDMLGQGDSAKRSEMFQNHTTSPTATALIKSLSRFSSQTSSTAGNMQVFTRALHAPGIDWEVRKDAIENIVGTLLQNVLFNTLKVKTAVPLFAFLFNMIVGGDDEERAAKKAQKFANDWLVPSKKGLDGSLADLTKSLVFGTKSEFFAMSKDTRHKTADAAIGTAFAGLLSNSLVDGLGMVPVVGTLAGYSSVSSGAKWLAANNAAERFMASELFMDLEVSKNYFDRNKIGIAEFDKDFIQFAADLTAPTADVYNTGKDVVQLYKGFNTRKVTPTELAMKALSIAVPITPEFNKQISKELKLKIKNEAPKHRRRND